MKDYCTTYYYISESIRQRDDEIKLMASKGWTMKHVLSEKSLGSRVLIFWEREMIR